VVVLYIIDPVAVVIPALSLDEVVITGGTRPIAAVTIPANIASPPEVKVAPIPVPPS